MQFGLFFWGTDQGTAALRAMRDVIPDLPRDVNIVLACMNAPAAPFVPEEHHSTPGYAALVTGFGSAEEHAAVAGALRARLAPLFEFVAQGAAMALEDALVLAESLTVAGNIQEALAAHQRRRRPRTDWVLRQTHRRDRTRTLSPALRNPVLKMFGRRIFCANYRPLRERA